MARKEREQRDEIGGAGHPWPPGRPPRTLRREARACPRPCRLGRYHPHRFGTDTPGLRASARLSDLSAADRAGFCDWEACLKANGYAHACTVAEAGVEPCRVCTDAGDTCDGFPRSQAECVAGIVSAGRATCHLGLLEDCLIQRAIRGFGDARRTISCQLSDDACAGVLPGDRATDFAFADHETSQVTVERLIVELDMTRTVVRKEDLYFHGWEARLAAWDGGLPADTLVDAGHLNHDAAAE